jgi:CMP/dCMP kinase
VTVIAVDGPAASGKGTLARRLAAHYGLRHLDTGLLYRAVGRRSEKEGLDPIAAASALDLADLADPTLREEGAAQAASRVAVIPEVRRALCDLQRRIAAEPPGAVLDGRDIGTIVFPDAEAKIFVEASVEARARRRHRELLAQGVASIYSRVLQDMRERDARDRGRDIAPLTPAKDALVIDSSTLDAEGVFSRVVAHISRILPDLARG